MNLTGIHLYPIKSAAGVSLDVCEVDDFGLVGDRRMMVVDRAGRMITQRGVPTLALVRPRFEGDTLRISAPGLEDLLVPRVAEGGQPLDVEVWGDWVRASRIDRAADRWFSEVLGRDCRLVYMPHTTVREVDTRYTSPGRRVSFADGFPFLLANEASLADLNGRLAAPMPMERFRPNLVVDGDAPFAEDGWKQVLVGTVRLDVVKPCARCSITLVDPVTGALGKEPLATLATYRKVDDKVLFGQNLVHRNRGYVRVGDPVVVTQ